MGPLTLTPAELTALHAVQLRMLLDFDRVCRTLGLRYQLAAGTLLGAVRHGGFIPWDDDIDVAMPRADYQRLLTEAPSLLGPGHFLQHWRSDPAFHRHFTKLRRDCSEFREAASAHLPHHHGIFIDILPFDGAAPGHGRGRLHLTAAWLAARVGALLNQSGRDPNRPRWRRHLDRLTAPLALFCPFSWRARLYERWIIRTAPADATHLTCLVTMPRNWRKTRALVRPRAEFLTTAPLPFAGHTFPAPAAHDATLTRLYGDYRSLPPPEKRHPTHAVLTFRLPDP